MRISMIGAVFYAGCFTIFLCTVLPKDQKKQSQHQEPKKSYVYETPKDLEMDSTIGPNKRIYLNHVHDMK